MQIVEYEQIQSQIISAVNPEKEQRKSRKSKKLGIDLAPQFIETWWKYVEFKID